MPKNAVITPQKKEEDPSDDKNVINKLDNITGDLDAKVAQLENSIKKNESIMKSEVAIRDKQLRLKEQQIEEKNKEIEDEFLKDKNILEIWNLNKEECINNIQTNLDLLKTSKQYNKNLLQIKKPNLSSSNGMKHNKTFRKYYGFGYI